MLRKLINKLFPNIPTGVSTEMSLHYTMNKSDYWNLVEYRNPIFNKTGGYEHVSGLYIKSPNLADDIAMYRFYYGGLYLFSIRLSTDTGESIFIFHCDDNNKSAYGDGIMHLISPYKNDDGFNSHPEFSDLDFITLYKKCMDVLFRITRSGMGMVLAERKRQAELIETARKKKHDEAFEKVKNFITGRK